MSRRYPALNAAETDALRRYVCDAATSNFCHSCGCVPVGEGLMLTLEPIDPEVTAGIIAGTIERLVDKSKIKIKVHPDHLPIIEQQIDRFKGDSNAVKEIAIEPDNRVRYGGCFIETPTGDIDARVDSQLDIIAEEIGTFEDVS